MTQPFPTTSLAPFEIDITRFFREIQGRVRGMRKLRRLAPLVPDVLFGKEELSRQISAPSAIIVPTSVRYTSARKWPDSQDPTPIYSQWLGLEVSCWGDDDPSKLDPLWSFSTTLEIAREIIVAITDSNYGPSSVKVEHSEWVQETDRNRSGRKLFLKLEVETFVVRDPPILMPTATATTPGVQVNYTEWITSPDGSSTVQVASFVAPP